MGSEQDPLTSNPPKEDTRSSSEIKSDIRRTRGRLDDTLENLNERLSPRSIINDVLSWFETQGTDQTGNSLKRGYRNVIRQVKENPMPALLIGAGITWMILGAENDDSPKIEDRTFHGADDRSMPGSPGVGEPEFLSYEKSEKGGVATQSKREHWASSRCPLRCY
jgi:hypothetical protein